MRLDTITALVTGGASGLGAATAEAFVAAGAKVVITDLPSSPGADTAAALGPGARFVPADITDPDSLATPLDAACESGQLRAVVHCAGRGGDRLRILDKAGKPAALDSYRQVLEVNLVGTYNVLRLGAAAMAGNTLDDGDRGAIVLTASAAAFEGQIGQTSYSASKGGVHAMTLVAARDLASWQIRVNTIAPGTFDTPMLARLREDIRESIAETIPHPKRLGHAADYADLALSVVRNPYLNGETIRLDGALRMGPR
ncbi:3-hydroxy-2-methylbutyryl-CoA dehydrogenase [Amycolatopsis sp. NBRC 101858]|uniref:SDR family NAD(P)-dependent oxidoreductase n=1 Tax=Amycolatopsis sp. NBRC 101858 TaxID=3032200 RepID=UPI0024A5F6D6|nr:SDR family NAD(P)-dependent oxidoreductase [Amycolatopsis sp. NBRC 101858]GLY38914.1 3-hydroxy-2-methylbutyryl-CoA dehydrogenase [Amycolatopsis sp. NBRC 101858]